jgi:glycosyltransferase involved in cell wall biosynthesis
MNDASYAAERRSVARATALSSVNIVDPPQVQGAAAPAADSARRSEAPVARSTYTLSVVIPCYNEVATIAEVIRQVRAAPVPRIEIVVVDDGSSDGTRALLSGPLAAQIDRVILHERNRGKGAALRTAFAAATGDVVLIQDADLEYDPADYPKLLAPILERNADVVYGSRFAGSESKRVVFFWHMVANRILTLACNAASNLNLSDMETGYKAFKRSAIAGLVLREERFGIEPELTIKLARRRLVFYEVGIHYHGRTYDQGKKIGLRDAFRALYCIFRYGIGG